MPNINLKTLKHLFPSGHRPNAEDIKQPEGSSECGAYALVGAVGAFGHKLNQETLHYENPGPEDVNRTGTLQGENFHDRSRVVYRVTGILKSPPPPELQQEYDPDLGNSPAAMAQVALQLGMHVDIRAQKVAMEKLMEIYHGARQRCIDAVGKDHVDPNAGQYEPPGENEVKVLLVRRKSSGSMHWVAQGSDGHFYDPIDGSTTHTWHPKNFGGQLGKDYVFLGLWMIVSR